MCYFSPRCVNRFFATVNSFCIWAFRLSSSSRVKVVRRIPIQALGIVDSFSVLNYLITFGCKRFVSEVSCKLYMFEASHNKIILFSNMKVKQTEFYSLKAISYNLNIFLLKLFAVFLVYQAHKQHRLLWFLLSFFLTFQTISGTIL